MAAVNQVSLKLHTKTYLYLFSNNIYADTHYLIYELNLTDVKRILILNQTLIFSLT